MIVFMTEGARGEPRGKHARSFQGFVGLIALALTFGCNPCSSPGGTVLSPNGDIVKDHSTQVGCSCTIVLDHNPPHADNNLVGPTAFNVCLPPDLNVQLDAGAVALSDTDWASKVDAYCTGVLANTMKDLFAMASRNSCTNVTEDTPNPNNITRVDCTHQVLPNTNNLATAPNPACAKQCQAVNCNFDNCKNDEVFPDCSFADQSTECAIFPDKCHCTVFTPFLDRFSACGFTQNSDVFCMPPPGGADPPTNTTGLATFVLSGPNHVAFDSAHSTAQLTIKFEDGFGFTHTDTETVHLNGSALLYGRCMKGSDCTMLFDTTLFAEDVTFHFSNVVCGLTCVKDVNVTVSHMSAVAGMGTQYVHVDPSGIGRIPMGALQVHAEAFLNGIPDKPMQQAASDLSNDQPIDFMADFAAKTFTISNAPFHVDQADGSLTLVGKIINQPPVPHPGADQTVECTSPTGGTVTLDASASTDPDDDILAYEWWKGPPAFGPGGGTPVASTAVATITAPFIPPRTTTSYAVSVVDRHLVTRIETTNVTVQDTSPPTVSITAAPDCLWAPEHSMVLFQLGAGLSARAVDACDTAPALAIAGVKSSQPETGGGSANTSPDFSFGKHSVCLRSEREGTSAAPRAYTVAVRATDASGNSASADVVVRVGHDTASLRCPKADPQLIVPDNDPRCTY